MAIALSIFIQQMAQDFFHLIHSGSLFIIAIVGQVAISTRVICLSTGTSRNHPSYLQYLRLSRLDTNWVLVAYAACLGFAGIITMLIWIVPRESLETLFRQTPDFGFKQYRIFWTLEVFIALILISVGYWKLIYKPVKEIRVV